MSLREEARIWLTNRGWYQRGDDEYVDSAGTAGSVPSNIAVGIQQARDEAERRSLLVRLAAGLAAHGHESENSSCCLSASAIAEMAKKTLDALLGGAALAPECWEEGPSGAICNNHPAHDGLHSGIAKLDGKKQLIRWGDDWEAGDVPSSLSKLP